MNPSNWEFRPNSKKNLKLYIIRRNYKWHVSVNWRVWNMFTLLAVYHFILPFVLLKTIVMIRISISLLCIYCIVAYGALYQCLCQLTMISFKAFTNIPPPPWFCHIIMCVCIELIINTFCINQPWFITVISKWMFLKYFTISLSINICINSVIY